MAGTWVCSKGATLLVPSGPDSKKHLFALLLDPVIVDGYGPKPCVLLACVTSIRAGVDHDDSCLLGPSDHPFIQHDSYVDFRFSRIDTAEHVQSRISEGIFIEKEHCSPATISKIVKGALISRRISREFKAMLQKVLFD